MRLIKAGSKFLPKIVEKLQSNIYCFVSDAFSCFKMLLDDGNPVLLSMLHHIIMAGLRESIFCQKPAAETIEFLEIYHEKVGYLTNLALAEFPRATKVLEFL